MKKIFTIVSMLAMVAVVACNDELAIEKVPGDASVKPATISLSIPKGGLTKVSLTQDANPDGSVKLAWESTDAITVKNAADESKSVAFTYVSGAGTSNAVFSTADVSALDGATSYNIYLTSNLPGGYNSQTQASNGSTAHLGYAASLKGVNKYDGASFSSAWAGAVENGSGTFESSSVLRIRAQMPTAAIADAVQKVIVKASEEIFGGEKELTVSITTPGVEGDGKVIIVYATLPAGDVVIPANTELLFQFQVSANNYDKYTHYRKVTSSATLSSGQVNSFKIDCPNIASYANSSTESIGTSTNPYLIGDKYQLGWLATNVANGKIYKLVDDIDATGFATSINPGGAITFDGNNKKISNLTAPLFNDLKGNVKDLTIYNAVVSSANTVGILANTCNTAASTVSGITVTGDAPSGDPLVYKSTLTSTATTATKYVGGLVGDISSGSSFDDCHVSNTAITAPNSDKTYAGGAFGYIHNANAKVGYTTKCTVSSSTVTAYNYAGGFVGFLNGGEINNNEVACAVSGQNRVGGLIGDMENGSLTGDSASGAVSGGKYYTGGLIGYMKIGSVNGCHATGDVTNTYGESYSHAGGLIGHTEGDVEVANSYYASGTVASAGKYAGGLIGSMYAGNVYNCYSTGNVTRTNSQYYIGGLIGQTHGTFTIHDCYATGTVTTCSHFAGGLIGIHDDGNLTLNKCYATANIVATAIKVANFGGLVGHVSGTVTININDCYATGNVGSIAGQNYVRRWCGGLIGATSEESTITISNSYSTSSFTTYSTPNGALIGNNSSISVTCTGYIGWSSLTAFAGNGNAVSTTDNYLGQEGTISSHASSLGWSTDIWDLSGSVPTLK